MNLLFRAILFDRININEGMLMESVAAQRLRHGRPRLYFYSRSDSQNRGNLIEIPSFLWGIESLMTLNINT